MTMINIKNPDINEDNNGKKNCNLCIFGNYYTSDGNLTRICHGYDISDEEAIEMINKEECEMYKEGHELYLEQVESGLGPCDFYCKTSGDKLWRIDRKNHSKEPTGWCGSFSPSPCSDSSDNLCYSRLGCTSCMDINDHNRRANVQANRDFMACMNELGLNV